MSLDGAEDNYDSLIYVEFSPWCNIQKEIRAIQEQFHIPDDRIHRNELLLATMGQSQDMSMMAIYVVALVLAILVAISGILMITGSLNSNIAQRTEFFGMLCCLGASKEQVIRFVRREALCWCKTAVPIGALSGTVIVWILSAILRFLSPTYFGGMPYFGISFIGLAAGSVIGVITVLLAVQPGEKGRRSFASYGSVRERFPDSADQKGCQYTFLQNRNGIGHTSCIGQPEKFYFNELFFCFQHYSLFVLFSGG